MIRVEFSNLTFGLEADIERVPNVKFIPLASSVLRNAIAERPILFGHFNKIDEHVLWSNARVLTQQLHNPPEQQLLLLYGPGIVRGDLDVNQVIAPIDCEIRRAVAEIHGVMLSNCHELIVFRHIERFMHRAV
ncbi:hypothetical protein CHELA40_10675 [Chelatococcus asaccharovorans]|nr:hypothetical protein CHELA40_10675 [Chelatococcus asaccharovorans]CAH1686287.1 hypothetical protein CHELA17_64931 [Chelatococcus asaccharovorans]